MTAVAQRYCRGCGQQRRLRWPNHEPTFCSKDCAAYFALVLVESPDTGYCETCGELNCNTDHNRVYDEEGALAEAR
jgi:hypothetical protein